MSEDKCAVVGASVPHLKLSNGHGTTRWSDSLLHGRPSFLAVTIGLPVPLIREPRRFEPLGSDPESCNALGKHLGVLFEPMLDTLRPRPYPPEPCICPPDNLPAPLPTPREGGDQRAALEG